MSLDISLLDDCCENCQRGDKVFSINITHNLGKMADEAGLYKVMWRPDENGFIVAHDAMDYLINGLALLEKYPVKYKALNPANGWGDYEYLVFSVKKYIEACKEYPYAKILVSR